MNRCGATYILSLVPALATPQPGAAADDIRAVAAMTGLDLPERLADAEALREWAATELQRHLSAELEARRTRLLAESLRAAPAGVNGSSS